MRREVLEYDSPQCAECEYSMDCEECQGCVRHCLCDPDDFDADELGLNPDEDL